VRFRRNCHYRVQSLALCQSEHSPRAHVDSLYFWARKVQLSGQVIRARRLPRGAVLSSAAALFSASGKALYIFILLILTEKEKSYEKSTLLVGRNRGPADAYYSC